MFQELRENNASPMDSSGSTAESFTSESGSSYNMEDDTIRSHIVSSRFLSGSPGANDPTVPKGDSQLILSMLISLGSMW